MLEEVLKEESSIGSGFSVSKKGYFATNYHVVSKAVLYPDKYSVVYFQ